MWNKGVRFVVQRVVLSVAALCCMIPVVYLLIRSVYYGEDFSFYQFENILLLKIEFYTWFWNSVSYTVAILLIHIPVSFLAAYGFSQFQFPCKKGLYYLYMILMLLPFQATVVPQYLTLNSIGLLDTRVAIILSCAFSAFGTFLLTQFMKGIDREILDAARLDGANSANILWHIIFPLCKPAIISLFILQFISCWAMVDQPLMFLRSEELLPLSLELHSQTFGVNVFAAGVIFAIVPLLAYLYCQEELEKGISLSSIK